MSIYKDPILQKYIDLITATTSVFKTIYQGDPIRIPTSNLPCLIVSKTSTQVQKFTNQEDESAIAIRFTVITDVRQDLSTNENFHDLRESVVKLYDIIEGRDDSTLALKSDSLLNILRTNIVVDAANNLRTDLDTITVVDYGEALRDRNPQWTIESRIDFVAHYIQVR